MDSDLYQIKWANITDYILRQTLFASSECGKKIANKLQTIKYQPCMHAYSQVLRLQHRAILQCHILKNWLIIHEENTKEMNV
jgi:hypothetical protein